MGKSDVDEEGGGERGGQEDKGGGDWARNGIR